MAWRGVYVTVTSSICCPASAGTLAAWAGTQQRTTDDLARHQEHRALLFIEREPRANNALAAASRVVQMNSTMLLLWAGQGRDDTSRRAPSRIGLVLLDIVARGTPIFVCSRRR
jgi:hypothetical protein